MWLSRKISSILKHNSKLSSFHTIQYRHHNKKRKEHNHQPEKEAQISFMLAVTSAAKNTGKSTLIQILDLEEITSTTLIQSPPLSQPTIGKLYRLKNNEQFIIHIIEYNHSSNNEIPLPTNVIKSLDGVFICYDTTNRESMDCLPDITNAFISQHIPSLLIGLKSDLTLQRAVDTQLSHLIGNLFGVQVIESNTTTPNGIQLIQNYFIQFIYSDQKMLQFNRRQAFEEEHYPVTTTPPTINITHTDHSSKLCTYNSSNSTIMSRISSSSTAATTTTTTTNKLETILNIVDELINTTSNQQDENMSIIFLTIYRKFMKPIDLVNILIQRFESDLLVLNSQEQEKQCSTNISHSAEEAPTIKLVLPTVRQERINIIFSLWLSRYWGDFKTSATRRVILEFLDKISAYEELECIYKELLPLASREPVLCDKDSHWGMTDELVIKEEQVTDTTKQQRKKDSGYSESFCDWIIHQQPQPPKEPIIKSIIKSTTTKLLSSSSLRRVASTNSHQRVFKSIVSLGPQNNKQDCSNNRRNSTPHASASSVQQQIVEEKRSSANFGGGLISIIEQEYISVDSFEIITNTLPIKLAEQLTYVEVELFQKIQPRDFLRHLWNQKGNKNITENNNNPVLASIEHFNFVSGWIASLIVNQTIFEKRVTVYEYCLKVAVELRILNNFNTLMAVLAGINSAAILRLKMTRESVRQRNKKLHEQFSDLESLMSSERSFSSYRSTLKQVKLPGIPYLGIHQQDLVSLGEANKDHKTDGKVHWKKFRLMGESILEMTRFQYPTYHLLEPNPYLLYFIGHESIPTEDERYEKSQEIEPRMLLKPSVSTTTSNSSTTTSASRWLTAALK